MDWDCAVRTAAGVAFVTVHLRNRTPVARRVRVENRLAGPLLPPRTEGVPAAGWDDSGVAVVVGPHETHPLGYACPLDAPTDDGSDAQLADPPAAVVADERVSEESRDPSATEGNRRRDDEATTSVRAVVRDRGRAAPPRDAVPAAGPGATAGTADADLPETGEVEVDRPDAGTTGEPAPPTDAAPTDGRRDPPDGRDAPADEYHGSLPPPVEAWLADVERRIAAAERLDPDTSVSTATTAVAALDVPPAALPARLAEDRGRLGTLADRIDRLAERADSASVPADHLRRLS
jgi:hypothetical protein